jgi:hypothetical protein
MQVEIRFFRYLFNKTFSLVACEQSNGHARMARPGGVSFPLEQQRSRPAHRRVGGKCLHSAYTGARKQKAQSRGLG